MLRTELRMLRTELNRSPWLGEVAGDADTSTTRAISVHTVNRRNPYKDLVGRDDLVLVL